MEAQNTLTNLSLNQLEVATIGDLFTAVINQHNLQRLQSIFSLEFVLSYLPVIASIMSTRRSSRSRNRRFAPSSRRLDVDGDDSRGSSPRTPLPGRARVSSARGSPSERTPPTASGRASTATQGPPSSLHRAASRSVGNQGGGSAGTPGKSTGVSKAICVSPGEVSTICRGKIGNWGVCADPITGPNKCNFKSHKNNKELPLFTDTFVDDSLVWFLPGQNRRAPAARVIVKGATLKDNEITTMGRQVLQSEEKTLEG